VERGAGDALLWEVDGGLGDLVSEGGEGVASTGLDQSSDAVVSGDPDERGAGGQDDGVVTVSSPSVVEEVDGSCFGVDADDAGPFVELAAARDYRVREAADEVGRVDEALTVDENGGVDVFAEGGLCPSDLGSGEVVEVDRLSRLLDLAQSR
jgi:hypothetical protein